METVKTLAQNPRTTLADTIKQYAKSDPTARELFEILSKRERNRRFFSLDKLMRELKEDGASIPEADVRRFFKQLEEYDLGLAHFDPKHEMPDHFEFRGLSVFNVGRMALGKPLKADTWAKRSHKKTKPQPKPEERRVEARPSAGPTFIMAIKLSTGQECRFVIPPRLTKDDAKLIAESFLELAS